MGNTKLIKETDEPILRVNGSYEVPSQCWTRIHDMGTLTGGATDCTFDCQNGSVQKVTVDGTINKLYVKNALEGASYLLIVSGVNTPAFTAFDTAGNSATGLAAIKTEGGFASFALTDASTDLVCIVGIGGNTALVSQAKDFKA